MTTPTDPADRQQAIEFMKQTLLQQAPMHTDAEAQALAEELVDQAIKNKGKPPEEWDVPG
jgi:hypothetical protein